MPASGKDRPPVFGDTAAVGTRPAAAGPAPAPALPPGLKITVITGSAPPAPPAAAPAPATPPVQSAPPSQSPPPLSGCQCRVQGTVEVDWDRPLQGRTRVTVFLEDYPKVQDTVELFMGSPRAFDLRGVPCGPHRLLFEARSKQRFILVSPEPRVDCTDGGFRQVKLVLQPAQGRRAAW
jgi:hypothetical protein